MLHSSGARDVYANLLRDTRGMRRDQASARDAWFAALPWDRKEETLFELEMLLKGIACFGNPRNHPGPPRRHPDAAHDFQEDLRIVRETVDRTIHVVRNLLGDRDRVYSFARYLESLLPDDTERSQLVREQLAQDTPIEALWVLRNALAQYLEVIDGMLRLGRVSHRLYHGIHGTLTREIGRNTYFNPLVSLEFRSEFDRIRVPEVLEALEMVGSESAHRVAALAMLTAFRSLRYLDLIDRYAADPATARLSFVILAVFRSDVRALSRYLTRSSADVMADGLERELLLVDADELRSAHGDLTHVIASIVSLRTALESIGESLRLEVRRVFEKDIASVGDAPTAHDLGPQVIVAAASLRAAIQHAIRGACAELRPEAQPPTLATTDAARRAASERLRREVWMFGQVLRAFLAKAKTPRGELDSWGANTSYQYVREFVKHFRAIGYQLVRTSDYDRLDAFLVAVDRLDDVHHIDKDTREKSLEECTALFTYLEQLFVRIGERAELKGIGFDKRAAAETLKLYIGAS